MQRHYQLVDVFTDQRFGGNQLAVFPEAEGIAGEDMQRIARELNLSESAFVLPPDDPAHHCRLRIFTPEMEMPMAGHPTVGTAFVLQRLGKIPSEGSVVFEEGVGPITVTLEQTEKGVHPWMQQPIPQMGSLFADRELIAELLSLQSDDLLADYPVQVVSAGVPFLYVPVKTLDAMGRIRLRFDLWETHFKAYEAPSIFAFSMETQDPAATVHSRMFAPAMGILEDPATGAASGPLGRYLVEHGLVSPEQSEHILSEQGVEMGRPSHIQIRVVRDGAVISAVYVGGYSQFIGAGYIEL